MVAWLYSYSNSGSQQLRVEHSVDFFPPISNAIALTITATLLSLISVIMLLAIKDFNKSWRPVLLVVQIVFLLFYTWQLL